MKFKSYIIIAFLSIFIVSCGSKKSVVKSKKKAPKETTSIKKMPSVKQNAHVKKLVKKNKKLNKYTLTYIKKYAPLAVIKMHEYKIPASITLAQGILESGNGRSTLASKSNNHFGIKCHTGWTGKRVYHDDDKKDDCFRKYRYVENSYNDHSKFLTGRRRYAFLFNYRIKDYKKWARGLKKAGYATDRKYPNKLIKIIEDYKLYEFDKVKKSDLKKYRKEVKKNQPKVVPVKKTVKPKKFSKGKTHTVKKGETLYSISRKYKITVSQLKKANNLSSNTISVGQTLKIK
ncbi:MAG: glucosaminidase domain-containing protein [Polaribacter sp.]|jgi:flagellum-specific peptidoglycan hydrolase FlgJ|nr:glucosaminidase domain-containing protein [Polaribacter sp.]MDG2074432.1 glucosaminidase domain-containing protein [Polaribacter sp.]